MEAVPIGIERVCGILLPREVQGTVSGDLGVWQEIITLLLINPFGWMAEFWQDRDTI